MDNRQACSELHGNVMGVGLSNDFRSLVKRQLPTSFTLEQLALAQQLKQQVDQGILQCDVVLLGSSVEDPIRTSQQVHSFDKSIPVIILAAAENCAELRRSVMFSPLLGNEVTPWSVEDRCGLIQALMTAAERHQQRRKYLDTIASVQPKLGNLTLSQPEVGHYLGRLLNQAPIGVISLDAEARVLAINRQAGRLLGAIERDTLGLHLTQFFSATGHGRLTNLLMRSAVAQVFGRKPEVFERVSSGTQVRYLEASATPIAYQAERRGYMVILQDVTERERAQLHRRKNEALMRTLSSALEQAADSVMITDALRVIEYVNPAFESLTGYSKSEAIGQETYFLRSGVQDKEFYGKLWETISSGGIYRGVLINRKKDGEEYHEEKTITALRNHEGEITHYVSTGHDITDRVNAEKAASIHQAELAHVSRISTLGEMTSGLAHELNQPLCAITTYAQTCLRVIRCEQSDVQREPGREPGNQNNRAKLRYGLEQVVKQAALADAIFGRLRNFARKRVLPRRAVSMTEIIGEVANLSQPELSQNHVTLRVEQDAGRHIVTVDPIQIEQVLLNLIRNSMDAMSNLPPDRRRISVYLTGVGRGKEVKVALSDCGGGCSGEVVERLFEPFYTTKANGLGIGLGISQSIIESHGGRLFLERNSSAGATFSFMLPALESSIDVSGGDIESDNQQAEQVDLFLR